jgi:hypothetical protein
MRLAYAALAVAVATICVAPRSASAQYCFSEQYFKTCSATCNTIIVAADIVAYGYNYKWIPENCCGHPVYVPGPQLGTCQIGELSEPETAKRLLALSKQDNLLVASCDGYLRPLPSLAVDERATAISNLSWSPDRQPLLPEDRLTP